MMKGKSMRLTEAQIKELREHAARNAEKAARIQNEFSKVGNR